MPTGTEHEECDTPCGGVLLRGEQPLDGLWCVGDELVPERELVDRRYHGEGVPPDEVVHVLGWHGRLEHLGLGERTEKPQGDTADVLVGALEVVAKVLADEDHL